MQQGSLLKDHVAKEIKLFDRNERVFLHPGSVLFGEAKIPSGFLTYFAKNMTTKVFLRDATEVPLYGILLFGGKVTVNHFAGGLMVGEGWVKMKAWTRIGVLVNQLRRLLDASVSSSSSSLRLSCLSRAWTSARKTDHLFSPFVPSRFCDAGCDAVGGSV